MRNQALTDYEAPWISEYGPQAHQDALEATEQKFLDHQAEGHTIATMWRESEENRRELEWAKEDRRKERRAQQQESVRGVSPESAVVSPWRRRGVDRSPESAVGGGSSKGKGSNGEKRRGNGSSSARKQSGGKERGPGSRSKGSGGVPPDPNDAEEPAHW